MGRWVDRRSGVVVTVETLTEPFERKIPRALLRGKPGDKIVTYPNGDKYPIRADLLESEYRWVE